MEAGELRLEQNRSLLDNNDSAICSLLLAIGYLKVLIG